MGAHLTRVMLRQGFEPLRRRCSVSACFSKDARTGIARLPAPSCLPVRLGLLYLDDHVCRFKDIRCPDNYPRPGRDIITDRAIYPIACASLNNALMPRCAYSPREAVRTSAINALAHDLWVNGRVMVIPLCFALPLSSALDVQQRHQAWHSCPDFCRERIEHR